MKHLWEAKHDYYCNEGSYFGGDCSSHHKSWTDFLDEFGDSDLDYGLVFRWDWEVRENDSGQPDPHPDDNYRADVFKVFMVAQRKGYYFWATVEVCRSDEQAVIAWLNPRLHHLQKLWAPLWSIE